MSASDIVYVWLYDLGGLAFYFGTLYYQVWEEEQVFAYSLSVTQSFGKDNHDTLMLHQIRSYMFNPQKSTTDRATV